MKRASPRTDIRGRQMREPDIPAPIEPGRRPALRLPRGATDCHAHVFGPQDRYPLLEKTHFVPHHTPWESYRAMLKSIGCERAVLIQPSVYGTDNSAIEHVLEHSAEGDGHFDLRAVAVVTSDVSSGELSRLHELGFRGIRINLASATTGLSMGDAHSLAQRIAPLGWHLQFYVDFHKNPEVADVLATLPVPVVVDHFGRIQAQEGAESEGFQMLCRFMERENAWLKLSAPYFVSSRFPDYPDIAPLASQLTAIAPDRLLWGTDWPHASAREKMQADAAFVDQLAQWVPDDRLRCRILVENPERLYGFSK